MEDPPPSSSESTKGKLDFTLSGGFNYAGLDAGAVIMASNKESKGTNNLLNSDPDKYALSPISAPSWWFVVGLSEEILVTSFVLSNLEKYSSSVKSFSLHASHTFHADGANNAWQFLGEFERPHQRGTQSFLVPRPKWARYLKLQVLSVFGREMYCTLTSFKVYGQTTIETLREDLALDSASAGGDVTKVAQAKEEEAEKLGCLAEDLYSIVQLPPASSASPSSSSSSESPFTDISLAPSLVSTSSSSMDNIFKTLMERVKQVEQEYVQLKAEGAKQHKLALLAVERAALENAQRNVAQQEKYTSLERELDRLAQRYLALEQLMLASLLVLVMWRVMICCK